MLAYVYTIDYTEEDNGTVAGSTSERANSSESCMFAYKITRVHANHVLSTYRVYLSLIVQHTLSGSPLPETPLPALLAAPI